MLTLTRPLVCLDLETSGIDPATDRIWEIGLIKIYPDDTHTEWETRVNPGVPIPPEVTAVTKITDSDLSNAPSFKDLAPMLAKGFEHVDFAGYNCRAFDLPFLEAEFARAGVMVDFSVARVVDAFKLYTKLRPRNLTAFIKDMLDEDFGSQAHAALADARGTWRALQACLAKYPELPREPAALHELLFGNDGDSIAGGKFYFLNGEAHINFGKFSKSKLRDVPRPYLQWVIRADFPPEVKKVCVDALQNVYPVREKNVGTPV